MNPHVKENVEEPSKKTGNVNRCQRILHSVRVESEEPMYSLDDFVKSSLYEMSDEA
jgi:hypothetical protein